MEYREEYTMSFDGLDHYKGNPLVELYMFKNLINKLTNNMSVDDLRRLFCLEKLDPRELNVLELHEPGNEEYLHLLNHQIVKYKVTINV
jgi:hypothetical protein